MAKILTNICVALVIAAALIIVSPLDVLAQDKKHYTHIINVASLQRMVTQQMSKETLLVALDHDKEIHVKQLKAAHALFDRTLRGLRNGDVALQLPATKNKKILKEIDRIEELWALFDTALKETMNGGSINRASVAIVADLNMPLLKAVDALIEEYKREASASNLVSMLAAAMDVGSNQRMLSQKMAKEILLIAYGHDAKKNTERLTKSIEMFETNLESMIEGNFEIQLLPAPTPTIRHQLRKVQTVWGRFRPIVQDTVKSGQIAPNTLKEMVSLNVVLLKEMNKAVQMYEEL